MSEMRAGCINLLGAGRFRRPHRCDHLLQTIIASSRGIEEQDDGNDRDETNAGPTYDFRKRYLSRNKFPRRLFPKMLTRRQRNVRKEAIMPVRMHILHCTPTDDMLQPALLG